MSGLLELVEPLTNCVNVVDGLEEDPIATATEPAVPDVVAYAGR